MPGGMPLGLNLGNCTSIVNAAVSTGIAVNPGAAANAKSATYTTIIAATAADTCWINVVLAYNGTGRGAVDIAVGPSGSEAIIANNLFIQSGATSRRSPHYNFPIAIPAGTRVSARSQTTIGSGDNGLLLVSCSFWDGAFTQMEGCAGVDAIGFSAATTVGTTITSNASANTKGVYAQLIAATSRDYIGYLLAFGTVTSPAGSQYYLTDLALGAASSELIILPNLNIIWGLGQVAMQPETVGPFFDSIPAGVRVSARCQSSTGGNNMELVLYGIYQ
jgi:hypothetical protein